MQKKGAANWSQTGTFLVSTTFLQGFSCYVTFFLLLPSDKLNSLRHDFVTKGTNYPQNRPSGGTSKLLRNYMEITWKLVGSCSVGWEVLDHHRSLHGGVLCIGSAVVTPLKEKEREAIAVDFASQAQKYFETITSRNYNNK